MSIHLGVVTAAAANGESTSDWSNPVLWVSIACGLGGLLLLVMDGLNRLAAARGGPVRDVLQNEAEVVRAIETNSSLTEEQKAVEEAKARATTEQALAAYKAMFLKFPQLVIGATLLVVPLFVLGGVSFGIPS
jgi:hypothetical protein